MHQLYLRRWRHRSKQPSLRSRLISLLSSLCACRCYLISFTTRGADCGCARPLLLSSLCFVVPKIDARFSCLPKLLWSRVSAENQDLVEIIVGKLYNSRTIKDLEECKLSSNKPGRWKLNQCTPREKTPSQLNCMLYEVKKLTWLRGPTS